MKKKSRPKKITDIRMDQSVSLLQNLIDENYNGVQSMITTTWETVEAKYILTITKTSKI